MSRLSKQDRNHMETAFHGPVSRRALAALDAAEASERDLKARLKAAGKHITTDCVKLCFGDGACACSEGRAWRAVNLKRKNWRGK